MVVLFAGQPTPADKWERIKGIEAEKLANRDIQVHPGELLQVINDPMLYSTILDIRSETDYNLFHVEDARRITFSDITNIEFIKDLRHAPSNTIVVVMSNNESDSTKAYKLLKGQGVLNLYILDGGVNHWLQVFPLDKNIAEPLDQVGKSGERLNFLFHRAVGATQSASNPGIEHGSEHQPIKFVQKVKIEKKKSISGGCG